MALNPQVVEALQVLQQQGIDVYPAAQWISNPNLTSGNLRVVHRTLGDILLRAVGKGSTAPYAETQARVYEVAYFCMNAGAYAQRSTLN